MGHLAGEWCLTTSDRIKYRLNDILDRQPTSRLPEETLQRINEILQMAEQREAQLKLSNNTSVERQPHDKEAKHVSIP